MPTVRVPPPPVVCYALTFPSAELVKKNHLTEHPEREAANQDGSGLRDDGTGRTAESHHDKHGLLDKVKAKIHLDKA
jgi:hypothetical protein